MDRCRIGSTVKMAGANVPCEFFSQKEKTYCVNSFQHKAPTHFDWIQRKFQKFALTARKTEKGEPRIHAHLRLIQTTTQRDPPTRVVPRSLQVLIYRHLQTTVWANKDHHITRLQKRFLFSSSYKASSELSGVCFKLRLYWCFLWRSFTSSTVWKTYTRHPQACDKFIKTKGNETNPYMKQVQQEIWLQLTKMTPNNDQWEIPRMIIKCYESWTRMEKRKHTNNLVLTS